MKNTKKHFFGLVIQGFFWILPIIIISMIILWLYEKTNFIANNLFNLVDFHPQKNEFLWLLAVVCILLILLYIIGHFVETRLALWTQNFLNKIPAYGTIKDIIGIFNSSKKGENRVLVVIIKGFATQGYNIGLMYSQKESIITDHFTVTLSQSPIPNGGYMFEVHKDNIFVIEEANFDDNLQYLLSMGVKSISEILNKKPQNIDEFISLDEWFKVSKLQNKI